MKILYMSNSIIGYILIFNWMTIIFTATCFSITYGSNYIVNSNDASITKFTTVAFIGFCLWYVLWLGGNGLITVYRRM
jgi:hypothetical protein